MLVGFVWSGIADDVTMLVVSYSLVHTAAAVDRDFEPSDSARDDAYPLDIILHTNYHERGT